MTKRKSPQGFTLVELLVYMGILTVFLTTSIVFAIDLIKTSQRARISLEVQQNIRFAMERMVREIRAADDLNAGASTFETSPGVLSLAHDNGSLDPTVFDVSGGILRITQGAGSAIDLTTDDVAITNLVFHNYSVSGKTTNIQIEITIQYRNAVGGVIYDVSSSRRSSVVIRERED